MIDCLWDNVLSKLCPYHILYRQHHTIRQYDEVLSQTGKTMRNRNMRIRIRSGIHITLYSIMTHSNTYPYTPTYILQVCYSGTMD